MSSILVDTRIKLGIEDESETVSDFDKELITLINSSFATLRQIGAITELYSIIDSSSEWDDVPSANKVVASMIPDYIYKKTRVEFDPPSSSFVLQSMKDGITELANRMLIEAEVGDPDV